MLRLLRITESLKSLTLEGQTDLYSLFPTRSPLSYLHKGALTTLTQLTVIVSFSHLQGEKFDLYHGLFADETISSLQALDTLRLEFHFPCGVKDLAFMDATSGGHWKYLDSAIADVQETGEVHHRLSGLKKLTLCFRVDGPGRPAEGRKIKKQVLEQLLNNEDGGDLQGIWELFRKQKLHLLLEEC